MKLLQKVFQSNQTIFQYLIGLDVLVLCLHLLAGSHSTFFHLDYERNLPTVYQSVKLIGFGSVFVWYGLHGSVKGSVKSFILPLALFLTGLGLDELLQIHENIYRLFEMFDLFHPSKIVETSMKMGYRSSLWILYYVPLFLIFVFWSGYWLHYFQAKMRHNVWILMLSSGCLFSVVLAEIFSSTGSLTDHSYYWLVTLEETAEMFLASSLILVGMKMLSRHR